MVNNLNTVIQPERPNITSLVGKTRNKTYFVDNSFQRRLVWTEKQKVRLIETVLINYPMPEIYLWQQPADAASGNQTSSIVDGQQRLTTITQFISNEFALKASALDQENRTKDFAGKFWKDLSDERKKGIWEYVINVRHIPSDVSEEEVRAVFRRLNETDKSLNPQELRNAEFNGEFITNAERLADLPFWRDWNFFTAAQLRRMGDIEFCSSLLMFLRLGIVDDTPASINETYDLFNDKYEQREQDFADSEKLLERIDRLTKGSEVVAKLFLGIVHLYALFVVLRDHAANMSDEALINGLAAFATEYGMPESENKLILTYREGAASRTRSKSNREKRITSLARWLRGDIPQKS